MSARPSGFLLAALVALGCRPPASNPALSPSGEVRWETGKGWLTQTTDGVTASATFLEAGPGAYLFEVRLEQASGGPELVAPEAIRFVIDDPEGCPSAAAEDPEVHLEALQKAMAQEKSLQSQAAGVSLVGDLLDLTALATTRTKADQARREEAQERRKASEARSGAASARFQARLESDHRHWAETALRKSTLAPGHPVQGQVVVRRMLPHAKRVSLQVPVGSRTFVFPFQVKES